MSVTCLAPLEHRTATSNSHLAQALEQAAAVVLLVLLSPVLVLVGLLIWAKSGRSPLVAHLRLGQHGRPLWVLKYRTMWEQSRVGRGLQLVEYVAANGARVKTDRDPRVTSRFARLCRQHSIDELPQLINVARGEMSLVGPRPITAEEMEEHYGEHAAEVLSARPGLSGLWQTRGRNRLTYRQRLRLDLFLVRRSCFLLYLKVVLATVPRVLSGKDAW